MFVVLKGWWAVLSRSFEILALGMGAGSRNLLSTSISVVLPSSWLDHMPIRPSRAEHALFFSSTEDASNGQFIIKREKNIGLSIDIFLLSCWCWHRYREGGARSLPFYCDFLMKREEHSDFARREDCLGRRREESGKRCFDFLTRSQSGGRRDERGLEEEGGFELREYGLEALFLCGFGVSGCIFCTIEWLIFRHNFICWIAPTQLLKYSEVVYSLAQIVGFVWSEQWIIPSCKRYDPYPFDSTDCDAG